ncbi:CheR family methyltransferase [Catalinimonas sp. 4WD22]|uniref:CheR family methyltransferase n=1 Tax=Catalinimonas locisalis TaxID=3133978 RepID=UPI003101138E
MSDIPDQNKNQTSDKPLTIVGIGASAGGLAALKTLFSHIPEDSGLAYVVVVHLSPDHESHLTGLLQPYIKMPVQQVTETVALEADHVYIIPPNCNLDTIDTHLRLSDLEEQRRDRAPIDHFFRTLAKVHDGHSIGIILSGTGSDGTLGIKEIKNQGGLTIVQSPGEADYDGMPQSAIATGLVDMILPLADIPPYIINFVSTKPHLSLTEVKGETDHDEEKMIQQIFRQVRTRNGRDFSRYKPSTILRRLQRRMQLFQIEQLDDYLALLKKSPEEVNALSDDFLINVTSFFRDSEVYEQLKEEVIPKLFEGKDQDDQLRVWSVGCSSGEEAYSIAMLLAEEADQSSVSPTFQVFASDLHEHSLQKAREGFYPGDIKADISAERLQRFFTKVDGGYRIRKELREMVIFTPHNLLSDPPFSRMDMIVCRNLLIYLKRGVQKDVIALFHYSLRPDGFLVLGTSEHLDNSELFGTKSKESAIFFKHNISGPEPQLPVFPNLRNQFSEESTPEKNTSTKPYGALHQQVVERYAPPSMLLNLDHRVLHISENAVRYLKVSAGEPSRDVFKMVRAELQLELRTVLYAARGEEENGDGISASNQKPKKQARSQAVSLMIEGQKREVIVSAHQVEQPSEENVVLVMFEEYDPATARHGKDTEDNRFSSASNLELKSELNNMRQRMQAVIKEHESSREKMKASNEELQSANEELRSTMEELETSKEELQSLNEELSTLNQENRHKVEELRQLSDDLQNLLSATDIATLFLSKELRILRFTPKLGELFNVSMVDRGRLITDLTHKLGYDELIDDARLVLEKLIPVEREVQDKHGKHYLTRVLPYRSNDDRIEGVVITFIEISERKKMENELREAKVYAESIIETLHEPLLVLYPDLRVKSTNAAFYEHFKVKPEETEGQLIYALGNGQWNIPELHTLLEEILPENNIFVDFEIRHHFDQIGHRVMLLNARRLDHVQFILLGMRDITEQKEGEEVLQRAKDEAIHSAGIKEEFLSSMSHEIRTPLNAIIGLSNLLLKKNNLPEQVENLHALQFSSRNLLNLINDILDYSKIEAGKAEIDAHDYSISTLLNSIRQAHLPLAEEKGNRLDFSIAEDVPSVLKGDSHKLAQVLNNLISNANKFTTAGSIRLEIKLEKQEEKEIDLYFAVRDSGIGIAKDKIQRIFDKFTQADSSTVRRYGGTGLGLSITKSLLQLMGSEIVVDSEEGEGALFYFILRQQLGSEEQLKPAEDALSEAQEGISKLKETVSILLVDDAEFNRMVLQQHLKHWWALQADEAENGKEAILKANQKKYDLILMDIRMPEMDGEEAICHIRKLDEHYARVPIIVLTADTSLKAVKNDLFDGVITKPFEPEQLMKTIYPFISEQIDEDSEPVEGRKIEKPSKPDPATPDQDVSTPDVTTPDISMPDFNKSEEIFEDSLDHKKKYYAMAISSLKNYKSDYLDALNQKDVQILDEVTHKAKPIFILLGLDTFYQKLDDTRKRMESGVSAEALQSERTAIEQGFEEIIGHINQRLEELAS